jgi:hypothetical protein
MGPGALLALHPEALPGVPLTLGADTLGMTVHQACRELGQTEVPRLWLQIIAKKG